MAYGKNAPWGLQPYNMVTSATYNAQVQPFRISSTVNGGIQTGYGTSLFKGDPVIWNTSDDAPQGAGASWSNGYMATSGTIAAYVPGYTNAAPSTWGTTPVLGVFQGVEYYSTEKSVNNVIFKDYWPAATQVVPGTEIVAKVVIDTNVIFNVQLSTHVDAVGNEFNELAPVLPVHNPLGANAASALAGNFGSNFALNIGGGTNFDTIRLTPGVAGTEMGYANNPLTGNTRTGLSGYYVDVTTPTGGDVTHDYSKQVATLPVKALGYTPHAENIARLNPSEPNGPYTTYNTPFLNILVTLNHTWKTAGTPGVVFA